MFISILLALLFAAPAPRAHTHLTLSPVGERITSIFENGTPVPQYRYVEFLSDGRGFTCGKVGFTTANGDALEAIRALCRLRPRNRLARFVPVLSRLAARESGDTRGLRGFKSAWQAESLRADFRRAQDQVAFRLYTAPALRYATLVGIQTPLGVECVYDLCMNGGDGDDVDGCRFIVNEAARFGTPSGRDISGHARHQISEAQFIQRLLSVRMFHLQHAADPETRAVWAESFDRCHALANLARAGNWQLRTPIRLKSRDYDQMIK